MINLKYKTMLLKKLFSLKFTKEFDQALSRVVKFKNDELSVTDKK